MRAIRYTWQNHSPLASQHPVVMMTPTEGHQNRKHRVVKHQAKLHNGSCDMSSHWRQCSQSNLAGSSGRLLVQSIPVCKPLFLVHKCRPTPKENAPHLRTHAFPSLCKCFTSVIMLLHGCRAKWSVSTIVQHMKSWNCLRSRGRGGEDVTTSLEDVL